MFTLFSTLIFLLYALIVAGAAWYLAFEKQRRPTLKVRPAFTVSVIIPFRNEKKHLAGLMSALRQQVYQGKAEFIFSDDHSEDGSDKVIINGIFPGCIYLPPVPGQAGKKTALTRAIEVASGEIILTTDADCIPGPNWLQSMINPFIDSQIQMVLGPVALGQNNWFGRLQSAEFHSIMAITSLSAALKKPLMANGANLAYRKEVFVKLSGYSGNEQVTSGDDEFLLRKIIFHFSDSVRFNSDSDALITAEPALTLIEFLNQRIRWAGKWKFQPDKISLAVATGVFCFQLLTIIILIDLFIQPSVWHSILVLKIFSEFLLLRESARQTNTSFHFYDHLIISMIYPFYVIIIALGTIFFKPHWKGRSVKI